MLWVRGKAEAHEPALPAPDSFRGREEGRGRGGARGPYTIYADVRTMKARSHNVAGGAPASARALASANRLVSKTKTEESLVVPTHPILDPIFEGRFVANPGGK